MRAFVFLLVLSTAGCNLFGPSGSLDGLWVAQLGKFSRVCVTLTQDGDDISGSAAATSENFLVFSGVPVHGEYPMVDFTVGEANTAACCRHYAGTTFTGRRDSSEEIVGRYGSSDIRFERADFDPCVTAPTRSAP